MPSTPRELDEEERAWEAETEVESQHRPHRPEVDRDVDRASLRSPCVEDRPDGRERPVLDERRVVPRRERLSHPVEPSGPQVTRILRALGEVGRAADVPRPVDPPCRLDRDSTGHDERTTLDALEVPDRDASARPRDVEDVRSENLTFVDEDRMRVKALDRGGARSAIRRSVEMCEEEPRPVRPDEGLL